MRRPNIWFLRLAGKKAIIIWVEYVFVAERQAKKRNIDKKNDKTLLTTTHHCDYSFLKGNEWEVGITQKKNGERKEIPIICCHSKTLSFGPPNFFFARLVSNWDAIIMLKLKQKSCRVSLTQFNGWICYANMLCRYAKLNGIESELDEWYVTVI